ncbi:MAG: hypothetical protein DRI95_10190 [Bacteroidetes bacterium]|nr:MAG: hypothetical protein DRI95_10190 [Bacteroidota bacterium]
MKEYSREILSTPLDLVTDGQINFGCFSDDFKNINYLDTNKPFGFPIPRAFKYLRLKEWQAFQLGNKDYFILIAVYNAKSIAINQLIFYNKKNKQLLKYEKQVPFWKTKIAKNFQDSVSKFAEKNFNIEIVNKLVENFVSIKIDIRKHQKLPAIKAEFEINMQNKPNSAIVVSIPFGKNRGMYSFKNLSRVKGVLKYGTIEIQFEPEDSFSIMDNHKGYYPYNMKYDWVTGACIQNNELIGFNLTNNQSINPEKFNENGLWKDNKLYLLPPVKFLRPNGTDKEWLIRDNYNLVDLSFFPEIPNNFKLNLIALKSDYSGPFGYFKGYIKYAPGKKIKLDDYFGMGEKKFVRS